MATWDDSKKFWFETGRTAVIALLGGVAAWFFLKPYERALEYKAEVDKKKLEINIDAIDAFLKTGYEYTRAAHDAFASEQRDGIERKNFEGMVYDDYQTAQNRLYVYSTAQGFDLGSQLKRVDDLERKLHGLFDEFIKGEKGLPWRDVRDTLKEANKELAVRAFQEAWKSKAPN